MARMMENELMAEGGAERRMVVGGDGREEGDGRYCLLSVY